MLAFALIMMFGASSAAAAPADVVVAAGTRFPPPDAAWVGTSPHEFLDGEVTLFCGSHGVLSGGGDPPARSGDSVVIRYDAVFTGVLTMRRSSALPTGSWTIEDPIRMTERITARGGRGATREYATELLAIEFTGEDFPPNVSVRESERRPSTGRLSISRDPRGRSRIRSVYQVWLELSLDGGRTWHSASEAVTMRLVPAAQTATIATRRGGAEP